MRIVRYMSEDSIELIINELQESKKNLARGAMQRLQPGGAAEDKDGRPQEALQGLPVSSIEV